MLILSLLLIVASLLAFAWYSGHLRAQRAALPVAELSEQQRQLAERLRAHVEMLASHIGERNLWHYAGLESAADYIETQLRATGWPVALQEYRTEQQPVKNLALEIPGNTHPDEIVLVGAHYDSVVGSPGANDNGSGVAVLLELARQLTDSRPSRTLRLVAFVNEEPPFFKSRAMGSLVYARTARTKGDKIVAMICLETLGYYSQQRSSQQFPAPLLRFYYPDRGNFLAFVGNFSSRQLLRNSLADFRRQSRFPAEGLIAPGWLTGVDWSDHWSFWQAGYPAIMLTDTAPFRYPHYHSRQDRPDKLSYPEFARAAEGIIAMVRQLTGE